METACWDIVRETATTRGQATEIQGFEIIFGTFMEGNRLIRSRLIQVRLLLETLFKT